MKPLPSYFGLQPATQIVIWSKITGGRLIQLATLSPSFPAFPDPSVLAALVVGAAAGYALHAYRARIRKAAPKGGEASERQAEHKLIFDSVPALIWMKDRTNRIVRVNKPAAAALGKLPSDLEGRATQELYPEESERYFADDLEVIRAGLPKFGIIEPLTDQRGGKRWVRTDKVPYRNQQDEIVGVIVFSQDITELKMVELRLQDALVESERANKAKSDLLSNVSHEIRTPLGVIMGFSELLMGSGLPDTTRISYAEKILRNGRRLMKLIEDLLDLARAEQGKLSVDAVAFSLSALLADVSSFVSQKAREKGLDFQVIHEGVLPDLITSDPSRLRQILVNVIDNAIKFTDRGKVSVTIKAPSADAFARDGRPLVEILVQDSGTGMTRQAISQLFEPFMQFSAVMRGNELGREEYVQLRRPLGQQIGSGLGLSLSRRLAQALGGTLELVDSLPGVGSTFRITFALMAPSPDTTATPAQDLTPGDSPGTSLRHLSVLLVEDNPDIQDMIRMYLESTGTRIAVAANGIDGVERALRESPDLILMDLQLPGLDGMRATALLRERGFKKPIIAMTAHAMKGQRQLCLNAGFDDFLTKPLSKDELLRKLQERI